MHDKGDPQCMPCHLQSCHLRPCRLRPRAHSIASISYGGHEAQIKIWRCMGGAYRGAWTDLSQSKLGPSRATGSLLIGFEAFCAASRCLDRNIETRRCWPSLWSSVTPVGGAFVSCGCIPGSTLLVTASSPSTPTRASSSCFRFRFFLLLFFFLAFGTAFVCSA